MIVYYVEGDKGHLLDEAVGMQRYRTAVRGAASSFHMPWRDILEDLQQNIADQDLEQLPRPQECLKYMLRAHVRVAGRSFKKHLKEVHVRPFVLIMLMDALIEQEHEVFRGKGTASFLRAKIRRAIEREYPETEADIPEDQRR